MKLENKEFGFERFADEMAKLRKEQHFDYLVTIVGEDFGAEEGLGCIYILENTQTHERCSVKQLAKQVDQEFVIPSVFNLWADADLLEREVYDFFGIKFLGHPDMRRLFLRNASWATHFARTTTWIQRRICTPQKTTSNWILPVNGI